MVKEKCADKSTEGETKLQFEIKNFFLNIEHLKYGFSSYGLLKIQENNQKVQLELLMQDVARLNSDCPVH